MSQPRFFRFFPTPIFLEMPAVGVDVSDSAIRYVSLKKARKGFVVSDFGEREVPAPLKGVDPLESKGFEGFLASFEREKNFRFVNLSLPESKAYLFRVELPRISMEDISSMLQLRLEEFVPVPAAEAVFDYEIVGNHEDSKTLLLNVTVLPARVAYAYLDLFKRVGFQPLSFEVEGQAIARAVVSKGDTRTLLLVNFSETRTTIFVVNGGAVGFSSTINFGSANLVEVIKKTHKVSSTEAEKMKLEKGFRLDRKNQDLFYALVNSLSVLRDEITKTVQYWQTHSEEKTGDSKDKIDSVIFCGHDVGLPGFLDYFNLNLGLPVLLGNVWTNVCDLNSYLPPISLNESFRYAAAVGLALARVD